MGHRTLIILVVAVATVLYGCGRASSSIQSNEKGMRFASIETQDRLIEELTQAHIPFRIVEIEGKKSVAYSLEDDTKVEEIVRAMLHGPPMGYTGYCPSTAEEANKLSDLLSRNNIPHVPSGDPKVPEICIHWPEAEDARVLAIDPMYRAIMKADIERRDAAVHLNIGRPPDELGKAQRNAPGTE